MVTDNDYSTIVESGSLIKKVNEEFSIETDIKNGEKLLIRKGFYRRVISDQRIVSWFYKEGDEWVLIVDIMALNIIRYHYTGLF